MSPFIVHARGFVREATAQLLRDHGAPVIEVGTEAAALHHLRRFPEAVFVCSEVPAVDAWARGRRVVLLDGAAADDVSRLLRRGADVLRPSGGSLSGLLDVALAGASTAPVDRVIELPSRVARPALTPRQIEVVQLIARGFTSHEIAGELGVRPKTVENYKQRAFVRLGVQNQAHAVARCARMGLVGDGLVSTLAG
jgi:DNA-binding NarL/FixJ family response regulator